MHPTPYFKIALLTLGTLVLAFVAIWNNAWAAAPVMAHAPVVALKGDADGVRKQIGWYSYEREENAVVLFCVPEGESSLSCVVFLIRDKGNALVLVDGLKASEQRT